MTPQSEELLFVGIKNCVVAIDRRNGFEAWRVKLKGSSFVTVLWDGDGLFAASQGEVFRLDPNTGAVLWTNPMKGLGLGVVSLAAMRRPESHTSYETIAEQKHREAAAATAAATA
ncbi:MAG: PQQ-binding-like beta-propeller repeat protein [Gemmatimonadaceae bacterium]|nr:PQQ-binding-like beta-propeller repeat protein [Gemmatimonadaceae bacterium]